MSKTTTTKQNTTGGEVVETTTAKATTAKADAVIQILIEGGDTDNDGDLDVRVRARVLGRTLLDIRRDMPTVSAIRAASSVVELVRRTLGRL